MNNESKSSQMSVFELVSILAIKSQMSVFKLVSILTIKISLPRSSVPVVAEGERSRAPAFSCRSKSLALRKEPPATQAKRNLKTKAINI